jgi:hypothetical protein
MKHVLLVLTVVAMIVATMIAFAVAAAAVEQNERDLLIVEPCDPGAPLCDLWV